MNRQWSICCELCLGGWGESHGEVHLLVGSWKVSRSPTGHEEGRGNSSRGNRTCKAWRNLSCLGNGEEFKKVGAYIGNSGGRCEQGCLPKLGKSLSILPNQVKVAGRGSRLSWELGKASGCRVPICVLSRKARPGDWGGESEWETVSSLFRTYC